MEKNELRNEISPKEILSQSIKGLQHLHSLGIGMLLFLVEFDIFII